MTPTGPPATSQPTAPTPTAPTLTAPTGRIARWGRWWDAHDRARDVTFATIAGVAAFVGYLSAEASGSERGVDWGGLALIGAMTVAFCFRRVAALRSFVVVIALTVVFWVADYATNFDGFALLAVYAAVVHGGDDRRRVWVVVAGGVAVLAAVATAGVILPDEDLPPIAIVGISAITLTAAVTGEVVYERRRRLVELQRRAERAEGERELLARQAVLDERARIARDMHDIVAHSMSVMVVQAGAAQRMVKQRPDQAFEALEHVQATGRAALTEMRRMLGLLRDVTDDRDEHGPQPTMDDLGDLVEHCTAAGVITDLVIDGERPEVASTAEMTAYRIVQEALTNIIKHGGRPVRAVVRVTYQPRHVRVEIDDDGLGSTLDAIERSTGHGLVGMRERVDLFGGSLRAGPRPGGGFRVSATIPIGVDAAASPAQGVA